MKKNSLAWNLRFESAVEAYTAAVYRSDKQATERESAAVTFRGLAGDFRSGDIQALQILKNALGSNNVLHRNTAARLLVEVDDRDADIYLVNYLQPYQEPFLEPVTLRLLGSKLHIHEKLWRTLIDLRPFQQTALLEGLLERQTETGLEYITHQMASKNLSTISNVIVKMLAHWKKNDLLEEIMGNPFPLVNQDLPYWLAKDLRLEAAFYLALSGKRNGIEFLERIASDPDSIQAAQATVQLAWLAWPAAITPTIALLGSTDTHTVSSALHAASILSCVAFGSKLLDLANRLDVSEPISGISLPDEAIRILEKISGKPMPEYMIEYVHGTTPDTFTESTRLRAISYYDEALRELDAARRYDHGKPITLPRLAENLLSPHNGIKQTAAYNLRAITGNDYGFDTDLDLIANLPAIIAWRERAKQSDPLTPGGWAFAGQRLPNPEL